MFSLKGKENIIFTYLHKIIPITYRNAAVLCQSECTCLHKTVNMVVSKMMKIPTQKRHANVQSCPTNKTREFK